MSRLDSFIRRLKAQRACLDAALRATVEVPGVVFELGLGNGRTFDHLREAVPGRRIIVFERDPQPHPDCWPASDDLIVGPLDATLSAVAGEWRRGVALIHSDIGTGDAARNASIAAFLGEVLPPFLAPGGIIVSDQNLDSPTLLPLPPPPDVAAGRYFLYRHG